MESEYFFRVAGLSFAVTLPHGWDAAALLPSFRPFLCEASRAENRIFLLTATAQPFVENGKNAELLGESTNDMGHVRLWRRSEGYQIEIDNSLLPGGMVHEMLADFRFSTARAYLHPEDPSLDMVLTSMIRILFAQAVIGCDGVSVHASCVNLQDSCYLFLGKSGTGKSTHAQQWLKAFPGCSLLNDDNPVLRIEGDQLMAYGTPWSGKTPCYKNEGYPVAGIVRLQQSAENHFVRLDGPDAFAALLPSCSAIQRDPHLQDALHETLIRICSLTVIGRLQCLPNLAAAQCCFEGLHDREIIAEDKEKRFDENLVVP